MEIIDAHHHLWKYNDRDYVWMTEGLESLRKDLLPEDFEPVIKRAGVTGTVAVQARQTIEETEWLLKLADSHEWMRGVVGWVPLVEPDVERHLEAFADRPKLRAVRHVLHDEPDPMYMLREDFNRGVDLLERFDLVYDILIFGRHLPQTIDFVDRHPRQTFVVDHIAKPRIKERVISPWHEQIRELAKRPNVYCKVSGMITEAEWQQWTPQQLEPYWEVVLAEFGPSRLMFGSDWPVLTLAGEYEAWLEAVRHLVLRMSPDEQKWIWGRTAAEAYRLGWC